MWNVVSIRFLAHIEFYLRLISEYPNIDAGTYPACPALYDFTLRSPPQYVIDHLRLFCYMGLNIGVDTLKPVQHFATRCVSVFADHSIFTDGSLPLRAQVLEFVARHCSDRVRENI
jgi:hypothetical protein